MSFLRRLAVQRSLAPATHDPDATDARLAAEGNADAFGRLYKRHAPRLHLLARRVVGTEHADDALQEIFVHTWTRLHQFRGEARFGTWLHRLAVNILLRQTETARRIARHVGYVEVDRVAAPRSGAVDAVMDVDAALARLSSDIRTVVVLHDLEGYPHDEIATALGISVSASKMRLHRGRLQLREWLPR